MSSEKTEKPSQRKLANARKEGQIFKSKDIVDSLGIIIALFFIKYFAPYISNEYNKYLQVVFSKDVLTISMKNLGTILTETAIIFLKFTLPLMLLLTVISIVGNIAQTGFMFTPKSLKIDIKRIDPISGFKQMFSKKSLLELIKFILKFIVIALIVYSDVLDSLTLTTNLMFHDLHTSTYLMLNNIIDALTKIALILLLFSFVDYILQKRFYLKDMRMSKQEVKDEYKQTEGDPLLKGKIKEKQREITSNALIKAAKDATVTIVNPTHIAICIKFETGMEVPIVTAIARDNTALKLKEISIENNVPIVENIPLARALYNDAEIDKPIPYEYFRPIAEILVSIMTANPNN